MRDVALDVETTGLDVAKHHRIIEIGCVELVSGRRSGKVFHTYLNPARSSSPEALKVHGLDDDFLRDKPSFADIADIFLALIKDARLVIHNAEFDLGFLNRELELIQKPSLKNDIVDTLLVAREKFPNQSNRLDALCQRFGIDISQRTKHGALLDAGLLAEVYIALCAGTQSSLALVAPQTPRAAVQQIAPKKLPSLQPSVRSDQADQARLSKIVRLTKEEIKSHQDFIARALGKNALWADLYDIKKDNR